MIEQLIAFSARNRFLVIIAALLLALGSFWAIRNTPLDAIPDLSPPQVIVQVTWKGQSPEIIEEQGTYPLVSRFLSIAGIETVRGFSTYGNALIYIIFKEETDLYWARSRVLEQLASMGQQLPASMEVTLGPDASGVGWVYEYALTSKSKSLSELRALQDYYYKYALTGVDGVGDVASVGGFVPTFEVTVNNRSLLRHKLSIGDIAKVLKANNNDTGGRILMQNGYEWMIQAQGFLKDLDAIRKLAVVQSGATPITLGDIAEVQMVPSNRRGIAELNGEGEVVGGIVMVRYGENAYRVIQEVKAKLATLKVEGVEIVPVYDRSELIEKAVATLTTTLIDESLIVILVIALFLLHLRSSLIILIILPLTIGITFLMMKLFGIGSNIMSLGGIAIAIGAMVDATIVMIENAHKALHKLKEERGSYSNEERIEAIIASSKTVGRPIFFALTLVVVSFLPIFALSGQEGLLFGPLAYTKSFAMAVGAILAVTLVPVLALYLIRGRIISEERHPLNRAFIWLYRQALQVAFRVRFVLLGACIALLGYMVPLYKGLNWEFMPPLNEESFMYMPVTPYGINVELSKALTQKSDAIIKNIPEVATVFGKGGRADSATDPAPLGMIESIITFKPQSEWREGMTYEKLQAELESALQIPGLVNSWTYPIRGRIDMLLSGIRTPLGIKLYGEDAVELQRISHEIEQRLRGLENTLSVFADQTAAGYYLDIAIDEKALQRYALSKDVLLQYVSAGIGGMELGTMYQGLERYPLALRYEEEERNTPEAIEHIMVKTARGFMPLSTFAEVRYRESAAVIKSEMAKPVTFVYITPKSGLSATAYQREAEALLADLTLPSGYYMEWAGQVRYLENAMEKIAFILPAVLVLTFILIYFALRQMVPTLIVFFTLPFAMVGGLLYVEWLDFNMSIAVVVGFLALLGIAAETAIVMFIYLQESIAEAQERYGLLGREQLREAIYVGAVQRLRPKLMTVFATIIALLPIMYNTGVGSEVMQRIAAPMIGGVVSSALLSLLIIPVVYELVMQRKIAKGRL